MDENYPTIEELEEIIQELRSENTRLKEEIRRIQRERHEVPPHYL
jgi:predicted nuclease with TOPRIM domain